jgi:hypothetical protein
MLQDTDLFSTKSKALSGRTEEVSFSLKKKTRLLLADKIISFKTHYQMLLLLLFCTKFQNNSGPLLMNNIVYNVFFSS